MKKLLISVVSVLLVVITFLCFQAKPGNKRVVGVIVPMEHVALTQIISGLKEGLESNSKEKVSLKVLNAQGDPNIQRAIIQQLVREGCDLLMPIGTAASQMTANLAKEKKIVCLAADIQTISPPKGASITSLNDELSAKDSLSFLHDVFPKIKKITLLYSSSEKVAKEVPLVLEAAKTQGIAVQKLMVQTQPELYTIGQAIAPDSEAIFVLKDHLIVSGIQSVVKQAEKRLIPVMTSDEGSVMVGAAFAIGVKEADIGREGAEIAKEVLNGTPPEKIPSRSLRGPFPLFVNQKACVMQGVDLNSFIKKAEELGLRIEYVKKGE